MPKAFVRGLPVMRSESAISARITSARRMGGEMNSIIALISYHRTCDSLAHQRYPTQQALLCRRSGSTTPRDSGTI